MAEIVRRSVMRRMLLLAVFGVLAWVITVLITVVRFRRRMVVLRVLHTPADAVAAETLQFFRIFFSIASRA